MGCVGGGGGRVGGGFLSLHHNALNICEKLPSCSVFLHIFRRTVHALNVMIFSTLTGQLEYIESGG